MLKRKISEYLVNWNEKEHKKCLIIDGPRQVGKTHIINEFIANHYEENHVFYIDFRDNYRISRIFKRGLDISRIYQEIKLNAPEKRLIEGESIIYFDNIQLCPEILPYYRAFTEDGLYTIISSGSSLDVVLKSSSKFPIGFFDRYHLDSLDFEEFLWANGYDLEQVQYFFDLYHNNELKDSSIHGLLIDLFSEYLAIGGMPQVVSEYRKQHNFKLAFDLQRKIIDTYYMEMEVHTRHTMYAKVVDCFESIPIQLTKDNKKFQYRLVSENGRATMYKKSVDWLVDSGIAIKSYNVSKPVRPINENKKEQTFKLYIHDPGLLVSMYGENTQLEILKGNLRVKNSAALENAVATILHRNNYDLYYFEKNSTLDIDFILTMNREIIPLLVKEADNAKSKALKSLEDKYGIYTGLRLSSLSSLEGTSKNIVPVYMAMNLEK
ncbi:Archaeal ATPase [Candidatus Izimaplasma bacterium HR1]|uniref:ATP-binding protein n=1 Tax=Candidatus Izimoplasma sp. HR1 TaxID=1541959 RepID=UPI0004F66F34|nr:Archaeal ATPase [Candidatus Izimaplasma bacterium HR1]